MTTETSDPAIEAWSDRLQERLTEAGMEPTQAEAYRHAFELGLTRVISQTATRQELQDGLAEVERKIAELRREIAELRGEITELRVEMATKQELKDEIAQVRQEMRDLRNELQREMEIRSRHLLIAMSLGFGIITALLSAILAIVA